MSRTRPAGEVDTCSLDGPLSGNNGDDNDYFAKGGLMTCNEEVGQFYDDDIAGFGLHGKLTEQKDDECEEPPG